MNDALSAELPLPATDCALAEPQSITQEQKIAKETMRSRTLWRRKLHATESLAGAAIATGSILANYYTEKPISLVGLVAVSAKEAASMPVYSTPKTLFYNQGTQKYQLEQTLQPGEQMWMDIGKLIRENVPDKTGKTLPSDLTTGSYEFRDLTNKGVGSLFEGKIIYDKTFGHVTYGCALCCGYSIPTPLWYDPISVIITSFEDDGVFAWYPCENQYDDVSTAFYNGWSSGAPSVVTVDYYGTHNGVAVGSTTSQTYGVLQSNNVHLMCPTHGFTPSGSANVTPSATIACAPTDLALGPTAPTSTANGSCGSSVNPTGGAFAWYIITNDPSNPISLNQSGGTASYTSANPSISVGDTTIQLIYTVNGQQVIANSAPIIVHKPKSLVVASDTGSTQNFNCFSDTGNAYCGVQRLIQYQVYDTIGNPIPIAGLPAVESFSAGGNNCAGVPSTPTPGNGQTLSNGNFNGPDQFAMCSSSCLPCVSPTNCDPTGSCTVSFTQTWSVAGVNVRTNSVAISCTQVQVTPQ